MKTQIISLLIILSTLSSCEERSGYYDEGQNNIIARLTSAEWVIQSITYPDSETYYPEYSIDTYRFDRNGQGLHRAQPSLVSPDREDYTEYFQWTFTTENFTVIYIGGNIESFWLIESLSPTDMQVCAAVQDPVLHPSVYKTRYTLRAVPKQ